MKTLSIIVYPNGKSKLTVASLHYNAENRASNVIIDFTEDSYVASWTKKADVVVSNNNTGRIFTGTTDAILSFDLTLDLMKTGTLTIYPYATRINNAEDEKVVYQAQVINVADFADLLGTDTSVTPSLAEQLQDQIDVIDATLLDKMDTDGSNSNVDVMTFNPDIAPVVTEGQISYNNESRTFQGGLGNDVVGSFFQEAYYPDTINSDTVTIPNGALVQYDGAVGNSGVIRVKRCLTNVALAGAIMGVATENIPVNQKGKITWFGKVNGIQTNGANYGETWVDGDMLYNHSTIVGGLSKVKPIAPKNASFVGIVVNAHATNGQLLIRPMFFPKLGQLSDVYTNGGVADGQVLVYDFANSRWHNATLDATQVAYGDGNVGEALDNKVDKVTGKSLIADTEITRLLGIETGAEVNNISDVNATDLTDGGDTNLHTHDERYYTEIETDALLSGKSDTTHNHDGVYAKITISATEPTTPSTNDLWLDIS